MKCLDDCHVYLLDTMMDREVEGIDEDQWKKNLAPSLTPSGSKVIIRFYEIRSNGIRVNGTTNEEVLEVLIHRVKELNKKFPCDENEMAIRNLEGALVWLNLRTQDRVNRGVEGTLTL